MSKPNLFLQQTQIPVQGASKIGMLKLMGITLILIRIRFNISVSIIGLDMPMFFGIVDIGNGD